MEKAQHVMILLYDYHNKQHIVLYLVLLHENILLYTTTAMLYLWYMLYYLLPT